MSLQQERERATKLQQDLATAKREVETQTALAAKTSEEASRLKQAAESGAELQMSLQQERERATKLQQDLAAAKREVETQTALAAKTSEEASRLKQASKGGAELQMSLQQERERATKLQQDLAAAKRKSRRRLRWRGTSPWHTQGQTLTKRPNRVSSASRRKPSRKAALLSFESRCNGSATRPSSWKGLLCLWST